MPGTIVATACVAIVALTPLASMAPGFKLSFSAVMLLLWLARRYSRRTTASRLLRAGVRIRELGAVQVMLLFGLLPLTVLIFNRIAFMAPGVNLIAVPVFTLVTVPFALAGLLLDGAFEPVGDQALLVAGQSVALIESLITAASDLPWSDVTIAEITAAAWLYIAMPLAWAVLPPGWPGRSIAMVGIAALVMHEPHGPQDGCVDIDVLDVGQGLAIVAATRRHTVVFDTGPAFRGGRTAADTVVIPFLKFRGIDRIDALIVSHADLDHAGGVGPITSTIEVARLLTGEPLSISEAGARKCVAGDGDRHDGIDFYFIHPGRGSAYAGNDASCVLIIQSGSRRVMLTGDIERRVEEELVSARAIPSVDAVVVPHHGSRTSSSAPFVNALRPSLAIVSAGHDNRWGFPKQDVVSRWQAVGAEVLSTSTSGAISLRLCRGSGIVSVRQQRQASRRIWHE
jgi:competence protein ComEC